MIRVLSIAIPSRILTLVLTEIAILFGCYFLAAWIDPDLADLTSFIQFDSGFQRVAIAVLIIVAGLYFRDLYSQVRITSRLSMVQELITVFGAAFIGQGLVHYVARDLTIPRKMMLIGSPMALAALIGWRLFFDAAARDVKAARRLLFIGLSPAVLEIASHLRSHPELGTIPIGYLSDEPEAVPIAGLKRLGGFSRLTEIIDREQPASLVIAHREDVLPAWTEEFLELNFGGVTIEDVGTMYERTFGRVNASEAWPPRFIVSDVFEPDPTTSRLQAIYAPVLAACVLLLCSPLMLAIALYIRLRSHGPVLERQWRAGQDGVPFQLCRFRTEPVPGGSLIRRLRLDSLPELFNVLGGSMSIVGPAPERPEYLEQLSSAIPFYRQRCRVKPGLTGWEQVHREPATANDTLRRLEYDLYYVKNLAPSLDSAVLLLALKERLF